MINFPGIKIVIIFFEMISKLSLNQMIPLQPNPLRWLLISSQLKSLLSQITQVRKW